MIIGPPPKFHGTRDNLWAGSRAFNRTTICSIVGRAAILALATRSGHGHNIVMELSRMSARHDKHPSSRTSRPHRSNVTYSCSSPVDAVQDLVGGLGPDEGVFALVRGVDEGSDLGYQVGD